jgi:hypothetical protein
MIPIRRSPETTPNDLLKEAPAQQGESNRQWVSRTGATEGIILLGGNSLAHFRIRVAQSHVRSDLLPSFWSLVGILTDNRAFVSVPLDLYGNASEIPRVNGVQLCRLDDYDDPARFPNIAVVQFTKDSQPIQENVDRIKWQRNVIDLPSLMLTWLGFIWGTGRSGNPLLDGYGVPSAALVETVYGLSRIELTPGLASTSSCPEAIWQAAKWWHQFYEGRVGTGDRAHAVATVPTGNFTIRQPAAAAVEHDDQPAAEAVRPRRSL